MPLTSVVPRGSFTRTVQGNATLDGSSPDSASARALPAGRVRPYAVANPFTKNISCSATASMGVEAKVQAGITSGISANWDLWNPNNTSVTVSAQAQAKGTVDAWVTGAASCDLAETDLGNSIPVGSVQFMVGYVPIVLVQSLQFVAEGSAGTEATLSTGAEAEITATASMTATKRGMGDPLE